MQVLQLKIVFFLTTEGNTSLVKPTEAPRISELEDNPEFNVKLGIIIGCTISAFCIVVLLLFIVWRNPCRLVEHLMVSGYHIVFFLSSWNSLALQCMLSCKCSLAFHVTRRFPKLLYFGWIPNSSKIVWYKKFQTSSWKPPQMLCFPRWNFCSIWINYFTTFYPSTSPVKHSCSKNLMPYLIPEQVYNFWGKWHIKQHVKKWLLCFRYIIWFLCGITQMFNKATSSNVTYSAFLTFRQVPLNHSTEKATVNGLPPLNGFLSSQHQQIAIHARQDNSASTEETSASSGMCQCRCTCGG